MPTRAHEHAVAMLVALLVFWARRCRAQVLPSGFKLRVSPTRGVMPDVQMYRAGNPAALGQERGLERGRPDLVVEVVSESDTAIGMQRKVEQYLRAGATAVWILYADPRNVIVYRRSGEIQRLGSGQSFQEPETLPGFIIQVEAIFAGT